MAAVLADDPDPLQHAGPLTPVLQGLLRKDPGQRMEPDEAAGCSARSRRRPAVGASGGGSGGGSVLRAAA